MAGHHIAYRRPGTSLRAALLAGVFAGVAVVGGCSSVPDALNPAEWYRSARDAVTGDDKAKAARQTAGKPSELKDARGTPPPGADKKYPNLAQVDERARRDDLSGGLSADPERPKYAPPVARQGEPMAPLQASPQTPPPPAVATAPPAARPPAPAVAAAPPPPAVPTPPVTPVPMAKPKPGEPMVSAAPQAPKRSTEPMTADQREQEARLTRQLAELRARAAEGSQVPANAQVPSSGEVSTIVVSSDGIETADFGLAPSQPGALLPPSGGGGSMVDNRGAMPVPLTAVKVATILFDNGSSSLKSRDKQILDAVKRLQSERGGVIRVVGHASSRTRNLAPVRHQMANFKISVDRADSVARELMRLGVPKDNILVAAVSDAEPMYYEIMPSGEAGNRRAEIYLGN